MCVKQQALHAIVRKRLSENRRASIDSVASAAIGERSHERELEWQREKETLEQTLLILRPLERALLARPAAETTAALAHCGGLSYSLPLTSFGSHLSINSLSSLSVSSVSSSASVSASALNVNANVNASNSLRRLSAPHHSPVEYRTSLVFRVFTVLLGTVLIRVRVMYGVRVRVQAFRLRVLSIEYVLYFVLVPEF